MIEELQGIGTVLREIRLLWLASCPHGPNGTSTTASSPKPFAIYRQ